MTSERRRRWALLSMTLLVGAGVVELASSAVEPRSPVLSGDERDYLAGASNLLRFGVVSFAPPGAAAPPPDAYREPGYPAMLAGAWRIAGVAPPASPEELERIAAGGGALRAARALHLAALTVAALAAGWIASRLASPSAGALAFALVAASPALGEAARHFAVESSAAALLTLGSAALVGAASGGGLLRACAAAVLVGTLPLVLAAGLAVIPAGAAALLYADWVRPPRRRAVRPLVFLLVAATPAIVWMSRNERALGHAVLSDRGGVVLAIRAELDAEVERSGAWAAVLAWTPFEPARRLGEQRAPAARFDRPGWKAESNFFSRAMQGWRARPEPDALSRDRATRREALAAIAERPGAHLLTTGVVAWRGLFAERSPAWTAPFDARLPIGLLLAAGVAALAWDAFREGGARRAALLAPTAALFVFYASATEFMPRFAEPLLPVGWTTVALLLAGRRAARERAAARGAAAPASRASRP